MVLFFVFWGDFLLQGLEFLLCWWNVASLNFFKIFLNLRYDLFIVDFRLLFRESCLRNLMFAICFCVGIKGNINLFLFKIFNLLMKVLDNYFMSQICLIFLFIFFFCLLSFDFQIHHLFMINKSFPFFLPQSLIHLLNLLPYFRIPVIPQNSRMKILKLQFSIKPQFL